jgi:hypothetical protein
VAQAAHHASAGAGIVVSSTAVADPAGGSTVKVIPGGLAVEGTVTGLRVTGTEVAIWWQLIDRHDSAIKSAQIPQLACHTDNMIHRQGQFSIPAQEAPVATANDFVAIPLAFLAKYVTGNIER